MDRVAVFVDAGYVFAQGSAILLGKKTTRGEITLDIDKAIAAFEEFACRITNLTLLRIYWYDGTSSGPTPQHVALAFKSNVKVRLGIVNKGGQQKGVDSLIVTDMITLARNRVMSDAVLLSGDEDVRVGVQLAQEFGVRVHLLGISPSRGSQSLLLLQEADTTHEWGKKEISTFLSCYKRAIATTPSSPLPAAQGQAPHIATTISLESFAIQAAKEIDPNVLDGLIKTFESQGTLPPEVDRPLLGRAGRAFGRLDKNQLSELRLALVSEMKRRLSQK